MGASGPEEGSVYEVPPEELPAHLASLEAARRQYERLQEGDGPDDGSAGVREPRRPSDSPPSLGAEPEAEEL